MTLLDRVPSSLVRVAGCAVLAAVLGLSSALGAAAADLRVMGRLALSFGSGDWSLGVRADTDARERRTDRLENFSTSGRGADHPVLRDGWTLREPALQRSAGRLAVSYKFDWDPEKAEANRRKHDVSFHEASTVFADPLAMLMQIPTIPSVRNAISSWAHRPRGGYSW